MSIERLNEAAKAAGYAMATPEEEPAASPLAHAPEATGRALVPIDAPRSAPPAINRDALVRIGSWVRDHIPAFGGRAPA